MNQTDLSAEVHPGRCSWDRLSHQGMKGHATLSVGWTPWLGTGCFSEEPWPWQRYLLKKQKIKAWSSCAFDFRTGKLRDFCPWRSKNNKEIEWPILLTFCFKVCNFLPCGKIPPLSNNTIQNPRKKKTIKHTHTLVCHCFWDEAEYYLALVDSRYLLLLPVQRNTGEMHFRSFGNAGKFVNSKHMFFEIGFCCFM